MLVCPFTQLRHLYRRVTPSTRLVRIKQLTMHPSVEKPLPEPPQQLVHKNEQGSLHEINQRLCFEIRKLQSEKDALQEKLSEAMQEAAHNRRVAAILKQSFNDIISYVRITGTECRTKIRDQEVEMQRSRENSENTAENMI